MDAVLAWSVVIFGWSLLLLWVSAMIEQTWLSVFSGLGIVYSIIAALLRLTVLFLQWAEAWPYLPQ